MTNASFLEIWRTGYLHGFLFPRSHLNKYHIKHDLMIPSNGCSFASYVIGLHSYNFLQDSFWWSWNCWKWLHSFRRSSSECLFWSWLWGTGCWKTLLASVTVVVVFFFLLKKTYVPYKFFGLVHLAIMECPLIFWSYHFHLLVLVVTHPSLFLW